MITRIRDGFDNKETLIKIDDTGKELWIEQTGIEGRQETLSYPTLKELQELKTMIETAITKRIWRQQNEST